MPMICRRGQRYRRQMSHLITSRARAVRARKVEQSHFRPPSSLRRYLASAETVTADSQYYDTCHGTTPTHSTIIMVACRRRFEAFC